MEPSVMRHNEPTTDEPKATTTEDHQKPRSDRPPMTPERRAELEEKAVNDGYRQRDGRWVKIY